MTRTRLAWILALAALALAVPSVGMHGGEDTAITLPRGDLPDLLRCETVGGTRCLADCRVEERFPNGNVKCACHMYTCKNDPDGFDQVCKSGRQAVYYETVDPDLESCGGG